MCDSSSKHSLYGLLFSASRNRLTLRNHTSKDLFSENCATALLSEALIPEQCAEGPKALGLFIVRLKIAIAFAVLEHDCL